MNNLLTFVINYKIFELIIPYWVIIIFICEIYIIMYVFSIIRYSIWHTKFIKLVRDIL
jgi:hypothetical protein